MSDENWGTPLGTDVSEQTSTQTKIPKSAKQSVIGLMYHFKNSIPHYMDGTVNAPALTKTFKNLREGGASYDDIYKMIDRFFYELQNTGKEKTKNIETWTWFIKRREELLKWVTANSSDYDVSEWK